MDPHKVLASYGCDGLRYFICTQGRYGSDIPFNEDDLKKRFDAHLVKTFSNCVNRALNLTCKLCKGKIPPQIQPPKKVCLPMTSVHAKPKRILFFRYSVFKN